jgi:hypothetical protein
MNSQLQAAVSKYLEKLQQECQEKQWAIMETRKPDVCEELEGEPPELQIAFLKAVLANAGTLTPSFSAGGETFLGKVFSAFKGPKLTERPLDWMAFKVLCNVVAGLLRQKLPFPPEDLAEMVDSYAQSIRHIHYYLSLAPLIGAVETGTRTAETVAAMRRLKEGFAYVLRQSNSKENRRLLERIDQYLAPGRAERLSPGGTWSSLVFAEIDDLAEPERSRWREVFFHCLAAQSTTPSKAWRRRSEELIATIGTSRVGECAARWLNPDVIPRTTDAGSQIAEKDADYLKGFIWLLAGLSTAETGKIVADCGLACLRKIPNVGPVSARVGFACVNALAEMRGMEPVAQLTRMRVKVKYAVGLKLIEKALSAAAERAGIGRDDLEDIAVSDYGLNANGMRSEKIGDCTVELVLRPGSGEVELGFKNAAGKPAKSPPAKLKQDHASDLKAIKRTAADMQEMLMAQRLRIEQFFFNERKMGYAHWSEHLIGHPLLGAIAKRLIWSFESNGSKTQGIWHNDEIVGWNNEPVPGLGESTAVQLWHPLQSDAQTILSWRCWLEDHHVVQPFKQAHREVYILTPAEEQTETYSNRFAAHVIRQHQFASLCRERGWQYRLMGSGFDGGNVPTLHVPGRSISAEFWVDLPEVRAGGDPRQGTEQISGSGINLYLLTDQVRFGRNGQPVRLAEIPPVVFSEIMRDVDLFVGVTSIGNDPTWIDGGDGRYGVYWRDFAFGDLSQSGETRRAILERLLPQLKIASRCKLEGKFLVVRGDLHTYKIHLGSGNVLMEPGSHYLCIVPGRGMGSWERGNLYLPFDGDQTLAIILSKALMLAEDKKITDETILRQIG